VLPTREPDVASIEEEEETVRVFTREQLDAMLHVVHPNFEALFRLLAGSGLRWGEAAAALRRGDLVLGRFPCDGTGPPQCDKGGHFKRRKSRDGARTYPLPGTSCGCFAAT
jgi:hypothetical protein